MKNKEFDLVDNVELHDQYLSFLDLENHPDWGSAWKSQNEKKVSEILHSLGVDLDYGWEISVCLHRSRISNKVEYGPRISFKERTDREWMRDNMAVEDIIRNTGDKSMREEMLVMSRRYNLGTATDVVLASGGGDNE